MMMEKIKEKKCIRCKELIANDAAICKNCGSLQTWKRHLNSGNTFLSLLLALIAILSFAIPVFNEMSISEQSDISAEFTFANDSSAHILISNNGKRPALLKNISFFLGDNQLVLEIYKIHSDESIAMIAQKSTSIVQIRNQFAIQNDFTNLSFDMGTPPKDYERLDNWLDELSDLAKDEVLDENFVVLGIMSAQSKIGSIDFDLLDRIQDDLIIEDNYERINSFLESDVYGHYELEETEYDPALQSFKRYHEARKILEVVEKYFEDKTSIKVEFYNSGGDDGEIILNLNYNTIRKFIFRFYFDNQDFDFRAISYFYPDYFEESPIIYVSF
ncbi:MAG: hypothetical protein JXR03_03590 [Cyclobacteriaceae bacterium]